MKQGFFLKNDSGMALVVALIMMIVLTLIGLATTFTSTFEIMLSGEKRRSTDAFYNADSGANILVLNYRNFDLGNFDPDNKIYNPFNDQSNPNPNPTNVTAKIEYNDGLKIPQEGDSFLGKYAYFWLRSTGDDRTGMAVRSTCTVELTVYRKLIEPD